MTRQPLKWTRGNRCARHFNKRFGVSEAAVAARQRAVAEKVEGALPDGAVEVLLIWIIEYGAMLLELIAITLMFIFKREFDISSLYGIREMDLIYYLFFGLIVVPAESLCDVLLLNVPASHGNGADEPNGQTEPASHMMHAVAPFAP